MKRLLLVFALCASLPAQAQGSKDLRDTMCEHAKRADAIKSLMDAKDIELLARGDYYQVRPVVIINNSPELKKVLKDSYEKEVQAFFQAKQKLEAFYQTLEPQEDK